MATHNYSSVGLRNVGSYQASGDPYISGTVESQTTLTMKRYQFPAVVREITIANLAGSNPIQISFISGSAGVDFSSSDSVTLGGSAAAANAAWAVAEVGAGAHFWEIAAGSSVTFRTKCKEMYVSALSGAADYKLLGELTNIPTSSMYHLSGSGLTSIDGT